jgi:heme exporter protein C
MYETLSQTLKQLYHKLGSPKYFYQMSSYWILPLSLLSVILFLLGLVGGLALAPVDYQQGQVYRVIYVHVPAAILSQSAYMLIAVCGLVYLVWRMKMAAMVARAAMILGASFALLTLLTGAIWGKPTWGTYWLWGDARLMSSLFLLFLYMGMIALRESFQDEDAGIRASSFLALIGVINIPIIKYSVIWWNTLHQPATIKLTEKSAMQMEMLWPLLVMILAFYVFFALMLILRVRNEILLSEQKSKWVQSLVLSNSGSFNSETVKKESHHD